MFGEKFLKPFAKEPQPTEEELTIARKANEEADPTTYSPLPLTGSMERIADSDTLRYSPTYKQGTDEYVQLSSLREPVKQQIIARVLKGIIPVSDVVSLKESQEVLFSKKMPLEKIERENASSSDFLADTELMSLVFRDVDHALVPADQDGPEYLNNVTHADNRLAYFDFHTGRIGNDLLASGPVTSLMREHTFASVTLLLEKIQLLRARIEGKEGYVFLEAILRDAKYSSEIVSREAERLQTLLLERLENAESLARVMSQELSWYQGAFADE